MKKINGKILLLVLAVTIVLTPFSAVLARNRNYENPYDRWLFDKIDSAREFFKSKPVEKKEKEAQATTRTSEGYKINHGEIELPASKIAEIRKEVGKEMERKGGLYSVEECRAAVKVKEAQAKVEAKALALDPKNIEEKAQAATKASEDLKDKAKEVYAVIKDFTGNSFDDKYKAALDNLEKNPNSLKLQLNMCNILMAYTDELYNSFTKAKEADLGALRDRVVQSFKTISELKAAEAQKYQNRANSAQGKWKVRYEQLSTACLNFSKAYELRAQSYQKIPMNDQMIEIQASIEYLDCVKEVLVGLKEFIETVQADAETLQQLQDTQKALANLQKSILTFSEVVLEGAFRASENLSNISKE